MRGPGSRRAVLAGRYQLLEVVGSGGMGAVWRARDRRTGGTVAVKVLRQGDGRHDALLRFVREQALRIRHPHVVAPTGWVAEDHAAAFAMDLCRGGSLQRLLEEHGPLPASYAAVLLDQLLDGLAAVHAAGVVHRDVKPANLLLEPTGSGRPHLRLGDFGVAALLDDVRLTRAPGPVGTDGYLAPEQARGEPPDPRQDLYAAGVVAVEMLTGRPGTTPPDGPLRPLLEALTRDDPDERPPHALAAQALLHDAGVPRATPWRGDERPPYVPDRYGVAPHGRALPAATACLAASPLLSLGALVPLGESWPLVALLLVAAGMLAAAGLRLLWSP